MSTAGISLCQTARTSTPVAVGSLAETRLAPEPPPLLRSVSRKSQMGRVGPAVSSSNMNYDKPAKTLNYRGWNVQIFLTMVTPTVCSGHVNISEDDILRCRIALAGQMDEANAILSLERKVADWIEEWLSRNHSGTTGLSEL